MWNFFFNLAIYLTPLHNAVIDDAFDVVQLLLKQPKIDINIKDMISILIFMILSCLVFIRRFL